MNCNFSQSDPPPRPAPLPSYLICDKCWKPAGTCWCKAFYAAIPVAVIIAILVGCACAAFAQPPLPIQLSNKTTAQAPINGGQILRDPIATTEKGKPSVADGIISDEADVNAYLVNLRGTGVVLKKTASIDAYPRPQIPIVRAQVMHTYGGIEVDQSCPDAELEFPRVAGVRDVGVWLEGGNATVIGGHSYGTDTSLRVGGNVNSGGGLVVGMTYSDARNCVEILTNGVQLIGGFSQNGFEHNIYAAGQCSLVCVRIDARKATDEWPNPLPVELTPKANWSTDIAGTTWIPKGGKPYTLNNVDGCTIQRKITCGGGDVVFRMNGGSMNVVTIDVIGIDPDHPAIVEINSLGADNVLHFKGVNYKVKLPANLSPSNSVDVRGAK